MWQHPISPAEGEQPVRSYDCTYYHSRLLGLEAKGQLWVTNKRLVFHADGKSNAGASVIQSEVPIADVSGISIYKGTYFSLLHLLAAFAVALVAGSLVPTMLLFLEISRTLFYERSQRTNQPFFPNAAREVFGGLLTHFVRTEAHPTNALLRRFLDRSAAAEIREVLGQHPDLEAMKAYIGLDDSPQTGGVLAELQLMIREVFVGHFRRPGTLGLRPLIREKGGRAVFIEYDLSIGSMLAPIYRLMLDMAIKEALGRKRAEGNVWFIIDEFRLIPNLQHVDNGVNFGRSLGAKFIIGVQNVEQLFHFYGEPLARSILSGFATTVAFRPNDAATRTYVQQLFGRNRKKETYTSTVSSRGLIEQVREANVVEDWDIVALQVGEAVIGLPHADPFRFCFDPYRV